MLNRSSDSVTALIFHNPCRVVEHVLFQHHQDKVGFEFFLLSDLPLYWDFNSNPQLFMINNYHHSLWGILFANVPLLGKIFA